MLNARLNRTPITRFACVATAIALLGLTVAIAGIAASAQNAGATFSGSLVDAIGRTVPDVPMVLSNPETSQTHEARSDQSGHFSFAGLPAGSYLLEVRKAGFATTQGRVTLRAGQILQQDVALQLGSLQETITLTDQPGPEAERVDSRVRQAPAQSEFDPCSESPVGGCIKQPTKVRDVKPRYPPAQHEAGSGGTVEIEARIDTEGFTKDLRVLEAANADFANAALEAVGQWQFTPTRLDGVPVEVRMKVTVNFIVRQ